MRRINFISMNATKKNNLKRVIQEKLKSLGISVDEYTENDRADLVGYDQNGKYFAVKLNDDKNTYFEGRNGIRMILCTSFEQFVSLVTNKKPLTQTTNPDLWQKLN